MGSIDNRVVSITFDNADFENKINSTLISLDKLKQGLDLSEATSQLSSISNINTDFSLDGIGDAIDSISDKFSALGAIGFTVIQNLTNSVLGFISSTKGKLVDPILSGGKERALSLEQAKFAFEGLGVDVNKAMASALAAVKGTAFGLGDAAKAASQLAASGIDVGDSMTKILRATAGVSAMTGSAFSEISAIFTGSAAAGKVSNQDLQQFATRGLNAAAAVGKQIGKTEQQVHEMATDGVLDFKTFSDAMDKAFGAHATEGNKTFAGSLSNLHTALARLGATAFTPALLQERDVFNKVTPIIDNFTAAVKPLIDAFITLSGIGTSGFIDFLNKINFDTITKNIPYLINDFNILFNGLQNIGRHIKDAFRDVFPHSLSTGFTAVTKAFGILINVILPSEETLEKLHRIFIGIFSIMSIGWTVIKTLTSVFSDMFKEWGAFHGIGGNLLNFFVKLAAKATELRESIANGGWENLDRIRRIFVGLFSILQILMGVIKIVAFTLRDMFKSFDTFNGTGTKFLEFIAEIADRITDLRIAMIHGAGVVGKLQRAFFGIVAIFNIIYTVIKVVASIFWDFFKTIHTFESTFNGTGSKILDYFANLGDGAVKLQKAIGDGSAIKEKLNGYITSINNFIDSLEIKEKVDKFLKLFERVKNSFNTLIDSDYFEYRVERIKITIDKFKESFKNIIDILDIDIKIDHVLEKFTDLKNALSEKFGKPAIDGSAVGDDSDKLANKWEVLHKAGQKIGDIFSWISDKLKLLGPSFRTIFDGIGDAIKNANFDNVLHTLNLGLFGGIIILINKFVKDGFSGLTGGVFDQIKTAFNGLTGVLEGMQQKIKAEIIQKIAIAVGILAAAIVILSLIPAKNLDRAMGAITIGFGQLLTTMKLMDQIASDSKKATKIATLAGAMVLIASAIVVLALATKIMASMSVEELARGLTGITVLLAAILMTINNMPEPFAMIGISAGIVAIATAVVIMAGAVRLMASLSPEELARGLIGVSVLLLGIIAAVNLMPSPFAMLGISTGIVAIAGSIVIMAGAVRLMASLSTEELTKGLLGVSVLLLGIIAAVNLMPSPFAMIGISAGIVAIATAVVIMAGAVRIFASMDLGQMIQGLVGIAIVLGTLVIAMHFMESALLGAASLVIVTGALILLFGVVSSFSALGIGSVITGMLGIAIAIGILAAVSAVLEPMIPIMAALGGALILIGIGMLTFGLAVFAFGAGVKLLVEALKIMQEIGIEGFKILFAALAALVPSIIKAIVDIVAGVLNAFPGILGPLKDALLSILNLLIEVIPTLAIAIGILLQAVFKIIRENLPDLVETGLNMIMSILKGIRDHIGEIVIAVGEIIVNFIDALTLKIPDIIKAAGKLVVAILKGIVDNMASVVKGATDVIKAFLDELGNNSQKVIDSGAALIIKILEGIAQKVQPIIDAGTKIITDFIIGIGKAVLDIIAAGTKIITDILAGIDQATQKIIDAGTKLIADFIIGVGKAVLTIVAVGTKIITDVIAGINQSTQTIIDAGTKLITDFITGMGKSALDITNAGLAALTNFLKGISDNIQQVIDAGGSLITNILVGLDAQVNPVINAGIKLITDFVSGIGRATGDIVKAGLDTILAFVSGLATDAVTFASKAADIVVNFLDALTAVIKEKGPRIEESAGKLAEAIIDGIVGGLGRFGYKVIDAIKQMAKDALGALAAMFDIHSPSRKTYAMGTYLAKGLANGLIDDTTAADSASRFGNSIIDKLNASLANASSMAVGMDEFNPTITPVLDLTNIQRDASKMNNLLGTPNIDASVSFEQAASLSLATKTQNGTSVDEKTNIATPSEANIINFNQTNNSPKALSADEIYRQTKSQIAFAKEKLTV